jgi:hypothetical protein
MAPSGSSSRPSMAGATTRNRQDGTVRGTNRNSPSSLPEPRRRRVRDTQPTIDPDHQVPSEPRPTRTHASRRHQRRTQCQLDARGSGVPGARTPRQERPAVEATLAVNTASLAHRCRRGGVHSIRPAQTHEAQTHEAQTHGPYPRA